MTKLYNYYVQWPVTRFFKETAAFERSKRREFLSKLILSKKLSVY